MKRLFPGLAALALAAPALAQPRVNAVVHSASYAPGQYEDFGIARGSLFVIFGANLGPQLLQQASSFPLKTDLAGTSVNIAAAGRTFAALMVYTSAGQVAALLPSPTPAGSAMLTLTYNSRTSSSFPIRVVESAFGIYTVNQAGTGPAVVTTAAYQPNATNLAANPGETLILWGTGLGAVAGDEAAGPLPGNLLSDVQVLIGTRLAQVRYAGRSGCCAGLDQIAFDVPAGVEGCFVPLAVRARGKTSNFGSLSIAAGGRQCTSEGPIPLPVLETATRGGVLKLGVIGVGPANLVSAVMSTIGVRDPAADFLANLMARIAPEHASREAAALAGRRLRQVVRSYRQSAASGTRPKPLRLDAGAVKRASTQPLVTAGFSRIGNFSPMSAYFLSSISAGNACSVFLCASGDCGLSAAFPQGAIRIGSALDAGTQLTIEGPSMTRNLTRVMRGQYKAALPAAASGALALGQYSVSGAGGADVGSFKAALSVPAELHWTNRDQFLLLDRSQDLTLTWTGGAPTGRVVIGGVSSNYTGGAIFLCTADAAAGTFTVPSLVLQAMPPAAPAGATYQPGRYVGQLFLASHPFDNTFSAPGLDLGYFRNISLEVKRLEYR